MTYTITFYKIDRKVKAMYVKVKAIEAYFKLAGIKPSIERRNKRDYNALGKYYAGDSRNGQFYQVNDGKYIRYYGNPFHNLYRIVSKNGSDFVIHQVR